MGIIYNNAKVKTIELIPAWGSIATTVIKAGTPMTAAGAIANNGDAIGLAAYDIGKTDPVRPASVIVSGLIDLAAVQTSYGSNLTEACKRALDEISFVKADGTLDTTSSAATPAATTTATGVVKMAANQVASTATDVAGIVANFNTLLASLKAAGIMAADAE